MRKNFVLKYFVLTYVQFVKYFNREFVPCLSSVKECFFFCRLFYFDYSMVVRNTIKNRNIHDDCVEQIMNKS